MFKDDHRQIRNLIQPFVANDDQTRGAIRELYNKSNYILDPHGAIGYLACRELLEKGQTGIFLETAHPAKFKDIVEESIGEPIEMPPWLEEILHKEKQAVKMPADYEAFKKWLKSVI
jgi:threonine synthase